jgi:hypothetical protein
MDLAVLVQVKASSEAFLLCRAKEPVQMPPGCTVAWLDLSD